MKLVMTASSNPPPNPSSARAKMKAPKGGAKLRVIVAAANTARAARRELRTPKVCERKEAEMQEMK